MANGDIRPHAVRIRPPVELIASPSPLWDRMGTRVERVGFAWERGKVRQP